MNPETIQKFLERHRAEMQRVELRQITPTGGSIRLDLWRSPFASDIADLVSEIHERALADVETQPGKVRYSVETFDASGATLGKLPCVLEGRADIEANERTSGELTSVVAGQQAFIRALLDTQLQAFQRYTGDSRELVKLVLDSNRDLSANMSDLQKTIRAQNSKREDVELARLQADIERMRMQAHMKTQETEDMLKIDQQERTMNALESLFTGWMAKSSPAPALAKFAKTLTGDQMAAIMGHLTAEQQIMFGGIHEALSASEAAPAVALAPAPAPENALTNGAGTSHEEPS